MSDDRHPIFITPKEYELGGLDGGNVGLALRTPEIEALLPALDLVIRLQPSEARKMAERLLWWADAVEAGPAPGGGAPPN